MSSQNSSTSASTTLQTVINKTAYNVDITKIDTETPFISYNDKPVNILPWKFDEKNTKYIKKNENSYLFVVKDEPEFNVAISDMKFLNQAGQQKHQQRLLSNAKSPQETFDNLMSTILDEKHTDFNTFKAVIGNTCKTYHKGLDSDICTELELNKCQAASYRNIKSILEPLPSQKIEDSNIIQHKMTQLASQCISFTDLIISDIQYQPLYNENREKMIEDKKNALQTPFADFKGKLYMRFCYSQQTDNGKQQLDAYEKLAKSILKISEYQLKKRHQSDPIKASERTIPYIKYISHKTAKGELKQIKWFEFPIECNNKDKRLTNLDFLPYAEKVDEKFAFRSIRHIIPSQRPVQTFCDFMQKRLVSFAFCIDRLTLWEKGPQSSIKFQGNTLLVITMNKTIKVETEYKAKEKIQIDSILPFGLTAADNDLITADDFCN